MLTEQEVLARLRTAVAEAGSLREFAKAHKLTAAYVHDVLHGRRALADRILAAIGVERTIVYRVIYQEKGAAQTVQSTPQTTPDADLSRKKDAPFEAS